MAPGRGPRGPVPKIKNPGVLLSRLMKFIFSRYLIHYVVVLICILTSVFCSVQGTLFMQTLIDRMDRTAMYSGLTARVPFADHRIIEYVFKLIWVTYPLN